MIINVAVVQYEHFWTFTLVYFLMLCIFVFILNVADDVQCESGISMRLYSLCELFSPSVLLDFCISYFSFCVFCASDLPCEVWQFDAAVQSSWAFFWYFCIPLVFTFNFVYFCIWSSMWVWLWQLKAAVQSSWANEPSGWAQERF